MSDSNKVTIHVGNPYSPDPVDWPYEQWRNWVRWQPDRARQIALRGVAHPQENHR